MIDIIKFKGERRGLGFKEVKHISEFNVIEGGTYEKNLKAAGSRKTDILINAENVPNNDKTHYRSSGLNHLACVSAKENNVAIGFNFSNLLNADNKAKILGRMRQNVRLCRKYKIRMMIGSFAENEFGMRHAKDLAAFGRSLGMTGSEVKKAMNFGKKEPLMKVIQ